MDIFANPGKINKLQSLGDGSLTCGEVRESIIDLFDDQIKKAATKFNIKLNDLGWNKDAILTRLREKFDYKSAVVDQRNVGYEDNYSPFESQNQPDFEAADNEYGTANNINSHSNSNQWPGEDEAMRRSNEDQRSTKSSNFTSQYNIESSNNSFSNKMIYLLSAGTALVSGVIVYATIGLTVNAIIIGAFAGAITRAVLGYTFEKSDDSSKSSSNFVDRELDRRSNSLNALITSNP